METSSAFLLTLGSILLLGLLTAEVARRTFLPRITLLLLFGIVIGQNGFNLIPPLFTEHFELIADITLLMVGFLLGGKLTQKNMAHSAKQTIGISISAALLTTLIVSLALIWLGLRLEIAIILGCIAAATDPIVILDIVAETKQKNKFSKLLLAIVALDDVWALMLFAFGMTIVGQLNGHGGDSNLLLVAVQEISGALLLGLVIGLPAAYLTGRIKPGQPMLTEALSIVFLCGGLAMYFEVSYLIAAMTMGAVVANMAKHHDYPFYAIEGIESLFMMVFFILAGASLELSTLNTIGIIGLVYITSRIAGKYLGAKLGAQVTKTDQATKQWIGPALLPQAGVAVGMALVAANQFPEYRQVLLPIAISTTIFFEIIGPIFTRLAIQKLKNSD
jgi:Kef-type K+ transport system membrane component KefB